MEQVLALPFQELQNRSSQVHIGAEYRWWCLMSFLCHWCLVIMAQVVATIQKFKVILLEVVCVDSKYLSDQKCCYQGDLA